MQLLLFCSFMQMSMNVPVVHITAALMLCAPTVMAATYVAANLDMMEMDMPVPVSHMCDKRTIFIFMLCPCFHNECQYNR